MKAFMFALALSLVAFATGAPSAAAAPAGSANSYKLDLTIKKGDRVVANPKLTVAFGKSAQATIINEKVGDGNYRIQTTASPNGVLADGRKKVKLDLVVLEQIAGAWVIMSEPSLTLVDGLSAELSLDGPVEKLGLIALATSNFSEKAINFKAENCPALTSPLMSTPTLTKASAQRRADCCSSGCADGSGRTMTCCGAIECCACGVCCSPPER